VAMKVVGESESGSGVGGLGGGLGRKRGW
jgi:hypothetical protein